MHKKPLFTQNHPQPVKWYRLIFILSMIVLRFVCEVGGNIPTYIQSSVITEFFCSKGLSYEEGLSRYTVVSLACSSVYLLNLFYKPLADKLGRKTIILINTFAMMIGFLFFKNASVFMIYAFGLAIMNMFIQNDVQMIYIMETFNNEDNGKAFGLIKSVGILGLLFIPYLREHVMNNRSALWRDIFIGPIVLALIALLLLALCLKESNVYLTEKNKQSAQIETQEKTSLLQAIKIVVKNKQLRLSTIAYSCFGACSIACYMYVESLMSINGMQPQQITKALYVYPIVYASMSFIGGILADKIGRKWVVVPCGFITAFGFIGFITAISNQANPYLIGLLNGIYLGAYWIMGDYISFIFIENISTEKRSTLLNGISTLAMVGSMSGIFLTTGLIKTIGLTKACLAMVVSLNLIAVIIILLTVKDTRGTDLSHVEGE